MQRRKFLIGVGSLAAGSAAAMGTGAFSIVSASRDLAVNVAGDQSAYLGFVPTSEYASIVDGQLVMQFNGANNQNGNGLNDDANSLFQNVFKIVNNGTNSITINVTGLDTSTSDGDGVDPIALYHTEDEVDENAPGYQEMDAMHGSPNPLGDENYGTSASYIELAPGDEVYVHIEFYLSSSDTLSDVKTWPAAIPDEVGFYAQGNFNN